MSTGLSGVYLQETHSHARREYCRLQCGFTWFTQAGIWQFGASWSYLWQMPANKWSMADCQVQTAAVSLRLIIASHLFLLLAPLTRSLREAKKTPNSRHSFIKSVFIWIWFPGLFPYCRLPVSKHTKPIKLRSILGWIYLLNARFFFFFFFACHGSVDLPVNKMPFCISSQQVRKLTCPTY